MAKISMEIVIDQLLSVLREAFEGPKESWSHFTDNSPDDGLIGTLSKIDAQKASRSVGGTSIAAHVHHVSFGLEVSSAWINGDRSPRNWKESWQISMVDEAAWQEMLKQVRREYEKLRQSIESNATSSLEAMGGAIAAIAHVAYHLGAIRQKVNVLAGK